MARIENNHLIVPGWGAKPQPRKRSCKHAWYVNNGRTYCDKCGKPHPTEGN
jgi:hypothetical protein